jgi:hypothetical protein
MTRGCLIINLDVSIGLNDRTVLYLLSSRLIKSGGVVLSIVLPYQLIYD